MKKQFEKCFLDIRKVLIVMYWKNLTLKLRHYIQTLLEILVPTLLFAAMLAIYLEGEIRISSRVNPPETYEETYADSNFCDA
jgi:hypothetical protein